MEINSRYYSSSLLHYISNQHDYYFKLDIMNTDILLEPYFHNNFASFEPNIKGELCNFLYLERPEITYENLQSLVGMIVLYQYRSKYSDYYHLRFVRILAIDKLKQTISLTNNLNSSQDVTLEKFTNLCNRSSAYRIWIPTRLYTEKIA